MNGDRIARLETRSLKSQCVETLERLIVSGELPVGEAMPPERELAKRLGISRPVVHEAMVELASRGFVAVEPRRGVKVKDYYKHGTLAIFESIVLHNEGIFPPEVLGDVLAFRRLIEMETAKLAAESGGGDSLADLESVVAAESDAGREASRDIDERVALDVRFHLLVAEASGNRILPLVMNSIQPMYGKMIKRFYETRPDMATVLSFHRDLVRAIAAKNVDEAVRIMAAMLDHGARSLA